MGRVIPERIDESDLEEAPNFMRAVIEVWRKAD